MIYKIVFIIKLSTIYKRLKIEFKHSRKIWDIWFSIRYYEYMIWKYKVVFYAFELVVH
jgi:hypothetical protein